MAYKAMKTIIMAWEDQPLTISATGNGISLSGFFSDIRGLQQSHPMKGEYPRDIYSLQGGILAHVYSCFGPKALPRDY